MKDLEKVEEFSKKIVCMAAKDGLTVEELEKAANMASTIACHSDVSKESIERHDFLSIYLATGNPFETNKITEGRSPLESLKRAFHHLTAGGNHGN